MELYAKGQLSFLILTCMLDRDFYGLDIITEISNRSNGKIQLKKPSVYSNLTRMEQQGYISSYLQSSDFGPNRKYYSITEEGRNFYKELKEYFDKNDIDVFKFFENDSTPKAIAQTFDEVAKQTALSHVEQSENEEKDEGFFDFSSIDSPSEIDEDDNTIELVEKDPVIKETLIDEESVHIQESINEEDQSSNIQSDESDTVSKQEDSSNYSLRVVLVNSKEESLAELESSTQTSAPKEDKKDDAVFLSNEDASEYNKRLYDISKEINRFKKKRSFAEDQISIASTDALNSSNEKKKANLEELKNAIHESKEKQQDNFDAYYFTRKANRASQVEQPVVESKEEVKDDAVFVTGRYDISQVEKAKKIEPPRLKIITEYTRETKLPTPKRDTSIDPSHKEILTKLYSKTRDNSSPEEREDSIYDYNDLKDFYTSQNIAFNVYKKPSERVTHNTNKLYFINALINFLLICGVSLISYFVFDALDWINLKLNFIYFVFPAISFINVCYRYYISRKYKGWHPAPMIAQWNIWGLLLLGLTMTFGVNFIFGFDFTNIAEFATTLIVPSVSLFVVLPIRYYVKRKILVKYWK